MKPEVTVISVWVKYNTNIEKMVSSLKHLPQVELRIVDNSEQPWSTYSEANNLATRGITTPYILLLNDDIQAFDDFLTPMIALMEKDPKHAIIGARLYYPNGSIQHAGVGFYMTGEAFNVGHYKGVDIPVYDQVNYCPVTFAAALIKTSVWNSLGGLDEHYINGFEDLDFCFKAMKSGYEVLYCPDAKLYHIEHASRTTEKDKDNWLYFVNKWRKELAVIMHMTQEKEKLCDVHTATEK